MREFILEKRFVTVNTVTRNLLNLKLLRHMKDPTQVKNTYACKYCDKDFAHLRSLKTLFTLEKNKFAFRIVTTKLPLKPV